MVKILIIEDDYIFSEFIVRTIKRIEKDLKIDIARDKKEAIGFLKTERFDLITLDGKLSNNDHGRSVLEEMTKNQISKTIVYSYDSDFVSESKRKKIKAVSKDATISDLIFIKENAIEFKKEAFK